MSTLLPILHPAMSLCSICPKPGACCKGFTLTQPEGGLTFWKESWQQDSAKWLADAGLPFVPERIAEEYQADDGTPYVALRYSCPCVTPEGRCGIYEDRPSLCRRFIPGNETDALCVFSQMRQKAA